MQTSTSAWQQERSVDANPLSYVCFFFEFEQVDEKGTWAWVVYDGDISQSRLFELQAELGDENFNAFSLLLGRQAKTLWLELGHGNFRLDHQDGGHLPIWPPPAIR